MRKRILLAIYIYCYFILIFFLQKILFLIVHASDNGGVTMLDSINILFHGLSLDMSMSGYLSIIPFLLLIASVWILPEYLSKIFNAYYTIILSVLSIITISDIVLYKYWGYHFDSSVFLYLQNPKEAFASTSYTELIVGVLMICLLFALLYCGYVFSVRKILLGLKSVRSRIGGSVILLILTASLFLPIRGGVTVSTMNIGHAYFSDRMFLNHAAINPTFNLLYSLSKSENFASQYQFYAEEEAVRIFEQLNEKPASDSVPQVLTTDRPNIIFVLLESFSYNVALDSIVAPNMWQYAKEGILFDNFFANSFRTDRGLVSTLSGYPAQPTASILKYPQKTATLPSIPRTLKEVGYKNQSMYYGGDINFTNMRSYFVGACGIEDIISDKEFPIKDRLTKWGVPDKILMERVYRDLMEQQDSPFLKVVLTLSSHEPFDVPTNKFDEPFFNAVNYTDECIGDFVSKLKATDMWENTLVVFVADHAMQNYPQGLSNYDRRNFRIPMVWIGGAVKQAMTVSDYASQNDIAATLLSQLGMDYSSFRFSKDVLNPDSRKFAFYSYVNGFSMIDSTGVYLYDNDQQKSLEQTGDANLEKEAKAFFQMMYLDLGRR